MKTESTQSTVLVADIPGILEDPARGAISLVGDSGGLSLITGPVTRSGLIMGTLAIETEHGVVYLDPEEPTQISEELPYSENHPWEVSWKIDSEASSPEEAAAKVWRESFGRNQAGPDDACVFTVRDCLTGETARIDLSQGSSVAARNEPEAGQ